MSIPNYQLPIPNSQKDFGSWRLGSWELFSGIGLSVSRRSRNALFLVLLGLVVRDSGLDRVLGKHRAVNLHRRQRQLGDDVGVLDRESLLDRLALQPFSGQAGAGDRRSAAERLELRVV